MKPILFLDFDGVLNTFQSRIDSGDGFNHLDSSRIALLNRIIAETQCDIVVSSSWRLFETEWPGPVARLNAILWKFGFQGNVRDVTPYFSWDERGDEIQAWLNANNHQGPFVIVDDGCDMAHLHRHLVRTTDRDGLQEHHVQEIVRRLLGGSQDMCYDPPFQEERRRGFVDEMPDSVL